jgi:hypothetical protein
MVGIIAARAAGDLFDPGCVGRWVKLGSESSSVVVVAGVRKSGNLAIWKYGNLEISKSEIQKRKFSISKSVLPEMFARSGLVETKTS